MPDLATLGRADAAGLTGRVRREVVVVHVALARHRGQRVELLLHAEHVQRRDAQDLGLAALEQGRTVDAGQDLDLGGQRPDVGQATAVDADLVLEDALADQRLLHRAVGGRDLLLAAGEGLRELALDAVLDLVDPGLALLLAGDGQRGGQLGRGRVEDGLVGVVGVVREERELLRRLGGLRGHLGLRLDELGDVRLGRLETGGHDLLGRGGGALVLDEGPGTLGRLGLDHHDRDVLGAVRGGHDATGDDHVEDGALELGVARERDPLAVDEGDADAADRAGEGRPDSWVDIDAALMATTS